MSFFSGNGNQLWIGTSGGSPLVLSPGIKWIKTIHRVHQHLYRLIKYWIECINSWHWNKYVKPLDQSSVVSCSPSIYLLNTSWAFLGECSGRVSVVTLFSEWWLHEMARIGSELIPRWDDDGYERWVWGGHFSRKMGHFFQQAFYMLLYNQQLAQQLLRNR